MVKNIRIAVAGLGTVGIGLLKLLQRRHAYFRTALGLSFHVVGVSARDRTKNRGIDLSNVAWFDDPVRLAQADDIDVVVELIGGEDGVAKATVEAAIGAGRSVVTANKALLARHGVALAKKAETRGVSLGFEAAVAGGIPVIKTMREALGGNDVSRVYGILNGTCNFILTKMQEEGRPFEDVLAEAQALGYAEADPTFDVGGHDTAHKLALLTSLAFGTRADFDQIELEGIQRITPADIEAADQLGYRIKLLGVAERTDHGIEQRVHPAMVAKHSAIAEVSGVTNAVALNGDAVGDLLLVGPGAGAGATASAVMGDLLDVARCRAFPPFIVPAVELAPAERAAEGTHRGAFYVRMSVFDRPGVMATICGCMADEDVSLESIVQRRPASVLPGTSATPEPGSQTSLVLITHGTIESRLRRAIAAIEASGDIMAEAAQIIRIEQL
ncbi:MAG: homoserine dehydrogenase [Pseudomonadota bacterium]